MKSACQGDIIQIEAAETNAELMTIVKMGFVKILMMETGVNQQLVRKIQIVMMENA